MKKVILAVAVAVAVVSVISVMPAEAMSLSEMASGAKNAMVNVAVSLKNMVVNTAVAVKNTAQKVAHAGLKATGDVVNDIDELVIGK